MNNKQKLALILKTYIYMNKDILYTDTLLSQAINEIKNLFNIDEEVDNIYNYITNTSNTINNNIPKTFWMYQININFVKKQLKNESVRKKFFEYLSNSDYSSNKTDILKIINWDISDTQALEQTLYDPQISLFFANILYQEDKSIIYQRAKTDYNNIDANPLQQNTNINIDRNDINITSIFSYNHWLTKTKKAILQQNLFLLWKNLWINTNKMIIDWELWNNFKKLINNINSKLIRTIQYNPMNNSILYNWDTYSISNMNDMMLFLQKIKEYNNLDSFNYYKTLKHDILKKYETNWEIHLQYAYRYFTISTTNTRQTATATTNPS